MNERVIALIDALDQLMPKDLLSMSDGEKKSLLKTTSVLVVYLNMELGGRLIQPSDPRAH